MKKSMAGIIIGAVVVIFLLAPTHSVEFLLGALTYHPRLTGLAMVILLALFIWVLRREYEDEPEKPVQL
jgi:heme A synthase